MHITITSFTGQWTHYTVIFNMCQSAPFQLYGNDDNYNTPGQKICLYNLGANPNRCETGSWLSMYIIVYQLLVGLYIIIWGKLIHQNHSKHDLLKVNFPE